MDELTTLKKIVAEVLSVDEETITANTKFIDDLGADSLDIAEIMVAIEDSFDVTIDDDVAEKIVTVGDAVQQIRNAIN